MHDPNALLYPGDLSPEDPPTLIWRTRLLAIPSNHQGAPRPFPFDPVIPLDVDGRLSGKQSFRWDEHQGPDGMIAQTAVVLDTDRNRVYRWLKRGLTADQADVIAIMFGLPPALIWTDWFAHAPSDEDVAAKTLTPTTPYESRIAEVHGRGLAHRQIAKVLMAEGVLTYFSGHIWTPAMVSSTISRMRRREVAA